MMNENLPNGIPPQHDSVKSSFVPFNGVGSSHSSRDSSPGRLHQVPLAQLLPGKMEIPPGQLPPRISNLTGQMARVSLAKPEGQTPFSSPKVFTSTPILEPSASIKPNVISPIVTARPVQNEVNAFTHSSTSQFASVKSGGEEEKKISSFFPGGEGHILFQPGLKTNGSVQKDKKLDLDRNQGETQQKTSHQIKSQMDVEDQSKQLQNQENHKTGLLENQAEAQQNKTGLIKNQQRQWGLSHGFPPSLQHQRSPVNMPGMVQQKIFGGQVPFGQVQPEFQSQSGSEVQSKSQVSEPHVLMGQKIQSGPYFQSGPHFQGGPQSLLSPQRPQNQFQPHQSQPGQVQTPFQSKPDLQSGVQSLLGQQGPQKQSQPHQTQPGQVQAGFQSKPGQILGLMGQQGPPRQQNQSQPHQTQTGQLQTGSQPSPQHQCPPYQIEGGQIQTGFQSKPDVHSGLQSQSQGQVQPQQIQVGQTQIGFQSKPDVQSGPQSLSGPPRSQNQSQPHQIQLGQVQPHPQQIQVGQTKIGFQSKPDVQVGHQSVQQGPPRPQNQSQPHQTHQGQVQTGFQSKPDVQSGPRGLLQQGQPGPQLQTQQIGFQSKSNIPPGQGQSGPQSVLGQGQAGPQSPAGQFGFQGNQTQPGQAGQFGSQNQSQGPGQQMGFQSGHQPLIQPHLQQQMRVPPPKSSDQNKAHLHTNRYPQRPNAAQASVQDQFQQSNFNQNQSVGGYQPVSSGYQPVSSGYQPVSTGYQPQSTGYQTQSTGYQTQSAGYQPPPTGYQPQSTGYQQQSFQNRSVTQSGFNKLWGNENFDLLQCPNILPQTKVEPPKINLGQEFLNSANCSSDIFRCTMTKIPESTALLQKSRLPLGVLIHPFKDLSNLPVIQCNTIVRCRTCRTYINPFVFFVDSKRWKCNLCYRVNELPEEFQYDPVSKTYGDPSRRPEVRSSTIEYIAPAEYMLRPPQPAIYLYLFDVSRLAVETGYLQTVCNVLSAEINSLPGDARTQIGFLCYDSCLHFYSLSEGQNQPHEMTVLDIDDIFIPTPDNLLVNLQDRMELVMDLLSQLPTRFANSYDNDSALGAALQAAFKMTSPTGGRITVFQTILPNKGPGAVVSREDPNQRSSSEIHHLNPANDFYKRLALECSGQQVAVDLFVLNSQYVDLATISGISRFSGGCIYHFPLFKASKTIQNEGFERAFRRYITRKIGFEAVMRIRCTRGLSIHTFHGNFFVRSTDLLSLPNINPDAGFGMQVSIEESLSDVQTICFQAALLYTSSKGERRIRVHTICLPVANTLHDIMNSADQQCIIGLLAKMAVDRSMESSLSDAREAFLNVAIDILTSYKMSLNMGSSTSGLMAPNCLKLLPLYISALLKSVAFRVGTSTRLDDRVRAMCDMKTKPLPYLIQQIYPDLYPVHNLDQQVTVLNEEEEQIHFPPHLQLTARNLDSNGAYLMDTGDHMILFVCANVSQTFLKEVLDVHEYNSLPEDIFEFPTLTNPQNRKLQMFLNYLNDDKPYPATFQVMKENSPHRVIFLERLIEDRLENSLSYHEFLQHIKSQVK